MNDAAQGPASGGVPNAFGNALAWKWTRQMSAYLRRSGLPTLLYALRAMANANGELRFSGDRKPIRIQDIAKAACANEKDGRRYMDAAIRAGVVTIRGERKRGVATLYVLLPSPFPDWQAAEDYLRSTARKPGKRPTEWSQNAQSSGDRDPNGSGDRDLNNPGFAHDLSHDGAEVVSQPQVVGAPEDQPDSHEPDPDDHTTWRICAGCDRRIMPDPQRPDRIRHARCETRAL